MQPNKMRRCVGLGMDEKKKARLLQLLAAPKTAHFRKMNDRFRYSFLSVRARVVFFLLDEKRRFFGFEKVYVRRFLKKLV